MTTHSERPKSRKVAKLAIAGALLASTVLGGAAGAYATLQASGTGDDVAPPTALQRTAFSPPRASSLADMVETVTPAVVQVQARSTPRVVPSGLEGLFAPFGGDRAPPSGSQAMGSGFVIDERGLVVTNAHVIAGADEVTVKLADGRELPATVVGRDEKTDLAVLRVKGGGRLTAVAWGNSGGVRIGEDVVAVGSPFGLGTTVTKGIVSGRERTIGAGPYDDFLQIDAPINQGNSGGPLFDASGKVVGVNTAIFSPSGGNVGIGFAIPSNMAKDVVAQLASKGSITRGQIGAAVQEVTPEIADGLGLANAKGALIGAVTPGSAAERAGLRPGDVVRNFNGAVIEDARDLPRAVAAAKIGERVSVVVIRGGRTLTLPVQIASPEGERGKQRARREGAERAADAPRLGVQVATANPELNAQAGQPRDAGGVMIMGVEPSSPAASQGLSAGDIVVAANTVAVTSPDELAGQLSRAARAGRGHVLLEVMRGGERSLIAVPLS